MRSRTTWTLKTSAANGLVLISLATLTVGCSWSQPRLGPVVEPEVLAQRLSEASDHLVLLDVRDKAAYEKGHVAGAIRVDLAVWKEKSLAADTGLDHESQWHDRIGALGITGRDPVVLYDDGRMTDAARIWFILQHFGVPDAGVLNGGYPALAPQIADGCIDVTDEAASPTPARFTPSPAGKGEIGLVERQQVREAMERGDAQILDTRTHEEYIGKELHKNPRGGHIPTAINLPHKQLLDEHNRIKSPDELAALFEQAGFKRGQPVIAHCQSGGRASLTALAAALAGYGPVFNYYPSFGDWAADTTCPLEKPTE